MSEAQKFFEGRYAEKCTPWDTGVPDEQLRRVIDEKMFLGKTVFEIGCGTGVNAIELAKRGYRVTAVDFVEHAIEVARQRALNAGVQVDFRACDVSAMDFETPYDLLFDRGVYHHARTVNLGAFQQMLQRATRPGSRWLSIAGNSKEEHDPGPPTVSEAEIRAELEPLFEILELRECRFGTDKQDFRPLAWAILMQRKS